MASEAPIIVANDVVKTYYSGKVRVEALRGISLSVEKGEMVAVMGPSGCGKTTLLNCLSGLDEIDAGSISISGSELAKMSDDQKTRYRATKMGYIFQSYNLLPVLTARENVELPLLVGGTTPRTAREKAMTALGLVGLTEREHHYPSELSGGQQQRVTIARALVNEPEIVWGDEPTGNLDSENSAEIIDLLVSLNKKNRQTFIIVTHADVVAARAHRVVRMQDGLIVNDGRNGAGRKAH
ncbi:MAG: ABC transporter ATP-binding protein [SAR202 cluster bacterium]|nr:ABC transporter ATP-binding protein [SAR202 cluster bacterium]